MFNHPTVDNHNSKGIPGYPNVALVSANKMNFTRCKLDGGEKERELYSSMSMPGYNIFQVN